MFKVLTIFGTRPEAIKMAPVINEIRRNNLQVHIAVTAQHRQMLDSVLEMFSLVPDYDLNLMKDNQDLFDITSDGLRGLSKIIDIDKPDLVLVHGDTTTAFIGSLAAFYKKIMVGHVEAGLRTRNKYSPYPEEINRKLVSVLADVHFAPTKMAKENLIKEGINENNIIVTGNTVIDAVLFVANNKYTSSFESDKRIILVTAHRRESFGEPMKQMFMALKNIADSYSDIEIIYPVHMNPNVTKMAQEILSNHNRIRLISPLSYEPFVHLMKKSYIIVTDSGGIQEEAPSLGKPVLVMREVTERPEGIDAGTIRLAGTTTKSIINHIKILLDNPEEYKKMTSSENPYGDGKASQRISQWICTQNNA